MFDNTPQLRTAGVIAAEVGQPLRRVLYLLQKCAVKPIGRAGTLRLFGADAVDAVRNELRAMDRRQEGS